MGWQIGMQDYTILVVNLGEESMHEYACNVVCNVGYSIMHWRKNQGGWEGSEYNYSGMYITQRSVYDKSCPSWVDGHSS